MVHYREHFQYRSFFPFFVSRLFFFFPLLLSACSPSTSIYPGMVLDDKTTTASDLRIIALGDAGTGGSQQILVADDLSSRAEFSPVDFILYLGDNFYETGVSSTADPLWTSAYTDIYDFNRLPVFYSVAGNHDHYGNALAEVDYSALDPTWVMPSLSYSFAWILSDGTRIDFLAIDTTILIDSSDAESHWKWIENRLKAASGGNLIVYGHHPLYSSGTHGDNQILIDRLQPLLADNGADLYLGGHDHNLEIRKPIDGVSYVVSGAGGKLRDLAETDDPQTLYAASIPGAVIIDVNSEGYTMTVRNSQDQSEPYTRNYSWN